MDRTKFLAELAEAAALAIELARKLQALRWWYDQMKYGPGNPTQITDAEASGIGATALDVVAAETAVEAVLAALINQDQISAFLKLRG